MLILLPILLQAAASTSAGDRAFDAYGKCLETNARQFATSDEPEETISTLTLVACDEQRDAVIEANAAELGSRAMAEQILARVDKELRDFIHAVIVEARSASN